MTWFRRLFVLPGTLLALIAAPLADPQLDAVLARLDQASLTFKGLTADVRKVGHIDVVNVDNADSGTMIVKRFKPGDVRIRIDLTNPPQNLAIGGGKAQVFKPKTNEAQEVDLGKNRSLVDQFMLLGFGSNSADLKNAYTVTLGGPDSINGEKTTRIMLVPKDPEVLPHLKKCELWISEKGWIVQQKFYTGGGDYQLSTYSRINWNPTIAEKDLKLDLPKGVKFDKLK
jgi:outer membrane lipoprotein-sorting protein